MYVVYVLKSTLKQYHYVWITKDMEKRLKQHNMWKTKSTKAYLPFKIIYIELVEDSKEARNREKYFKTWKWRNELKKLIV